MNTTRTKGKARRLATMILTAALLLIQVFSLGITTAEAADYAYTAWTENRNNYYIYIKENSTGDTKVAYCFSESGDTRPSPEGTPYQDAGVVTEYTVRALLYNGYPNNGGGLQEIFGLSDDRFRYVTQRAIWTYLGEGVLNYVWPGYALKSKAEKYCYDLLRGGESSVSYNGQTVTLTAPPSDFVV